MENSLAALGDFDVVAVPRFRHSSTAPNDGALVFDHLLAFRQFHFDRSRGSATVANIWRCTVAQMTFQLDDNSEIAIDELKEFFGTKSGAAAIRSALALARAIVPTRKDRTLLVPDQKKREDVRKVV